MISITNLTVLAKAQKYINLFNPKSFRTALEKGDGINTWTSDIKG